MPMAGVTGRVVVMRLVTRRGLMMGMRRQRTLVAMGDRFARRWYDTPIYAREALAAEKARLEAEKVAALEAELVEAKDAAQIMIYAWRS
mgnify:CR=1 FL=1